LNDILKRIAPILLLIAGITACASSQPPATSDETQDGLTREQELERRGIHRLSPDTVPVQSQGGTVGEVPDATITAIKDDLAKKLGISHDAIEVVMANAVMWNDGSLGCGQPGQSYIQVVVPGYQLILEVEGRRYDYRATEQGYLLLCELPTLLQQSMDRQTISQ